MLNETVEKVLVSLEMFKESTVSEVLNLNCLNLFQKDHENIKKLFEKKDSISREEAILLLEEI